MPTGSSLKYMMEAFPKRAFDVGIAEQHAVTMAAGMAAEGLIPFCAIYSTFLQRAYDQVIHDVAIQSLPVIFCIDRAGLVGQDGATHHGAYDLAYLRCIPDLTIFAPMNEMELRNIMYTAQKGIKQPIAIRYPRGRGINESWRSSFELIPIGSSRKLVEGSSIAVLSIGHIGNKVSEVLKKLGNPVEIGHFDMRFVKPLDQEQLHHVFANYSSVVTLEDGCLAGGFGSAVLEFANEHGYSQNVERLGLPDTFIEQGSLEELQELGRVDEEAITRCLIKLLHEVR